MATAQDIIVQAFFDLGAIAAGETPSTSELADGLVRLNQMLLSLSTEGATSFNQVVQQFPLTAGVGAYALGSGGTLATTGGLRAQKITAWRAFSGQYNAGGAVLPFSDFDKAAHEASVAFASVAAQIAGDEAALVAKVQAAMAPFMQTPVFVFPAVSLANAALPLVLGADTSWPQINVRMFPAPQFAATLELAYWTPIDTLATLATNVNLPPGYEDMLHFNLAIHLAPQYGRSGGVDPALAANAQNTKASIVQQNTIMGLAPQQAPPQQQQQ